MLVKDMYFANGQWACIKFENGRHALYVGYDEEFARNSEAVEKVIEGHFEDCMNLMVAMDIEIKKSMIG